MDELGKKHKQKEEDCWGLAAEQRGERSVFSMQRDEEDEDEEGLLLLNQQHVLYFLLVLGFLLGSRHDILQGDGIGGFSLLFC